jgi:hypothetical protein
MEKEGYVGFKKIEVPSIDSIVYSFMETKEKKYSIVLFLMVQSELTYSDNIKILSFV